jgi:O-antigen ligase
VRVGLASIPAVLDQALFATTNFVLSLQLARAVSHTEFGAFTLWLSVLILLGTVYASVVIGPMLVYGTTRYADDFRGYLGALSRAHLPLVVVPAAIALALAGALAALGEQGFAAYLAALAVAAPGVLLLWLARAACFVRASTRYLAPAAGAGYLVLMVGMVHLLGEGRISGPGILLAMGVAGLLCGAAVLALLRADVRGNTDDEAAPPDGQGARFTLRTLAAAHRSFGGWLLAITIVTWLMLNAYPFLIQSISGLSDAGGFQADMNLLAPLFQGTSAICILFMPMLAASRATRDFRRLVRSLAWLLGLAGGAFWLLMVVFGDQVVRFTYGESYVARASILPIIASVCVLNAVAGVYGAGLRSIERPQPVFRAYGCGTIILLVIGLALIPSAGLNGAAIGTVCAWLVVLVLLQRSCWQEWRLARRGVVRRTGAVFALGTADLSLFDPWGERDLLPNVADLAVDPAEPADPADDVEQPDPVFLHAPRRDVRARSATDTPTPIPTAPARLPDPAPVGRNRPLSPIDRGRRRVITALLALAPICFVVLAFDRNGAFSRGAFVRNLLPLGLIGLVGIAFVLSGQVTVVRPRWADRALLGLAGYVFIGFALRLHSGNSAESGLSIALGLLLATTHLLAVGTPSAGQCRTALRNICWAGTVYATTFAAANLGLLGATAPTFFKQMQSGILVIPLVAAVLSRRWALAAIVAATYAYGFLHYTGAEAQRDAGHGGTYLVVAATAGLVYLACRGANRRARLFRTVAVVVLLAGSFLVVRESAPPTSTAGSVASAARGGNESSEFRADVWGAALSKIAERPLLGSAFAGSIAVTVDKYTQSELLVHNDLLQLALDGGLLAACLYLFVIIDANRRALRGYQALRHAKMSDHGRLLLLAFIGFDAFIVVGLFNPAMFTASISSVGFAMYVLIRLLERSAVDHNRDVPRRSTKRLAPAPVAAATSVVDAPAR